jgi:DNA adenine methylase
MSRKTSALAPWMGSDRMVNAGYAEELDHCRLVGIPFGGGMGVVNGLSASTIHVNEKHSHIVNLAQVIADSMLREQVLSILKWTPFSELELRRCQKICRHFSKRAPSLEGDRVAWAHAYFVSVWMARNGTAGTKNELSAGLSVRWDAGGGDSAVRFQSAIRMLDDFGESMRRCCIRHGCFREFLPKIKDKPEHGIYADPPWDGPGKGYLHKFTEDDFRDLECMLVQYKQATVVVRINDTPLIRELFSGAWWTWVCLKSRDQHNNADKREVMLLRNHKNPTLVRGVGFAMAPGGLVSQEPNNLFQKD